MVSQFQSPERIYIFEEKRNEALALKKLHDFHAEEYSPRRIGYNADKKQYSKLRDLINLFLGTATNIIVRTYGSRV